MAATLAALLPSIIAAAGSAASAGIGAISDHETNNQAEKMATINQTKPGAPDLGTEMMKQDYNPSLTLGTKKRPVIFN